MKDITPLDTTANIGGFPDDMPITREKHVAERLREAILLGNFRPGERLDQLEITKQLQLSLSPVREAIRTLEAEGLVTIYPHRGAFVTERSHQELQELHFIRGVLEGAAIRRAVPYMNDHHLARLKEILDTADRTDSYEKIQSLNHDFHHTIYGAYEQPHLLQMIMQLRNKVAPYIRLYLDAGMRGEAWTAHRRIYEACANKDALGAEKETLLHIQQVGEGILAFLKKS